ncbi:EamA family transporter [Gordonia sp. NB41Y]|uniref:EamA family transporter n=1 Tax=Gordonia sp. NB41Y TaxID=875808 RepID=UPI00128F5940|nr:EamA family transporter [Gordonia sp. NB41Y]WLP88773.1 EamA family transporter [Gordonia sp. NB41Y]
MRSAGGTRQAVALVAGSCISLQFGAGLAANLFPTLGAWGTTVLRLAIAGIVLCAVARPRIGGWTRPQWRSVLAFGLAMALMNGFFYAAIARIPLGVAVSIEFLGPLVLAAVLSRRRADLAWVGLALLAMTLLGVESVLDTVGLDLVGVGFALAAGAAWAGYILTSSVVGEKIQGSGGLAVAVMIAAVGVLPVGLQGLVHAHVDATIVLLAVGMAVLSSVIPYTLELAALRRIPRHVFGVLLSLEPMAAALVGWMLLGQGLPPIRATAIVLVIFASVGATLTQARSSAQLVRQREIREECSGDRCASGCIDAAIPSTDSSGLVRDS